VILNNSTVSGNVADGGGGVFSFSTVVLNNSTITRNTGNVFGGGIYFDRDYLGNPNYAVTLQNTLLAGNFAGSGPDCMGPITSAGYNLIGNNSDCTFTPATGDQVGTQASPVHPILTPLQGKSPSPLTHALMAGSPAINAGNPASPGSGGSACLATDQRGVSRPVDVRCDIGAFEYQGNGTVPAQIFAYSGTPQFIQPGSPAASVLKALVLDADGDTVPGKAVTFTAPSSGPSAVFASTGTNTATVLTDAYGIAASPAFSTNSLHGGYTIKATVAGVAEAANFEILTFTQHVKTYTANGNATLPGTLLCDQTKPTCTNNINPHADAAHKYAMGTNTFYATQHERDSIDDQGMTIISTVHYEVGYDNAFWNGEQMVYGDAFGFALADDVVAHELTHGVTQYESNLFYYYQSGAINESFSDLWGEFYDQVNTQGNDAANVKWQIGEDVSGLGILRSMSTPPVYNDPDRMSSSYYYEGDEDNGGVHTNSGVNNKAVYLMVDGGNFNSKTVTALGWTKTAAIYYEAQTKLLFSGADYSDLYYALQQACKNLIGQKGISAVDCAEVKDALDAVEMNAQPATNFNTDAPLCDAGSAPNFVFSDDLEAGTSNWTFSNGTNLRWQVDSPLGPFAQSGLHSLYADDDPAKVTDAIARLKPIAIPANAYLHFAHAYDFESGYNTGDPTFYNFDGGVLEYSINNSSTWVDAGSLINFNGYKGTLFTGAGNPLSGRSAFVGASHGYISSRVDLAPLAGKAVIFRWRMGLDEAGLALGWWVDNVRLYTCIPFPGAFNKTAPANGSTGVGLTTTLAWSSSAYATSYQYCYDTIDDNQCNRTWNGGPSTTAGISNLGPNTTYYWQVRAANQVGGIDADNQTWGSFTTTSTLPPGATGVKTYIGVDQKGSYSLASGQSLRESYTGANNGPVKILSTSSTPLIGAERVVYKVNGVNTSFSELMGLPDSQLDNIYWLPWYNNTGDLDTQLRFANVSASTATVHVYIGGAEMSGSPFTLLSGESTRESFAGISNGPVKIESDVPIVAAERVVYKVAGVNTSFSEMMALPNSHLDTTYWLPWYNNVELDTQLRFANVSNSSATVRVYIGGAEMSGSPFTLGVGESTRKSFPGINNGPVKIESDVPIVAAERVVYKAAGLNTSFMEMMGLPAGQLDTTYWLPWYNNRDFDTQLRFANVSDTPATVHIYIGGVEMTGSPFTLEPDASTRQSFAGINNGPVQIVSDVPIVAAERLVFKVNGLGTSFFEMMALPNSQLDTTYWLPWYNNVELDTQLRFGIP
jgi:Zn-dependent metalloprotease